MLLTEITGLPPGHALDVGCGEGADAIWPARRGRQVTAVDVSRTAPERAAATAPDITGRVAWTRADLTVREPLLPRPVPTTPATLSAPAAAPSAEEVSRR